MKKRSILKRTLSLSCIALLLLLISSWIITAQVKRDVKSSIYETVTDIPTERVGIVFGARVRFNRTLTPILQDRVDGAIALYKAQKINKILMSGDNSSVDYNEVTVMQKYAVSQGIPVEDIALDHAGFSTYDTCYRAKEIFSLSKAVLITQRYHLYRALYTCQKLGVSAVGYALPDFERYPNLRIRYSIREYIAQMNAFIEVNLTHPQPKFLGNKEAI